jgi:molecular chaperone GrpE
MAKRAQDGPLGPEIETEAEVEEAPEAAQEAAERPPSPVSESLESPEDQLERAERERDESLARLQRAQADYANLRRRAQIDLDSALQRSLRPLLEGLLLVVDHLDLALAAPQESDESRNLARGVRLTRDQLLRALAQEGVQPIPQSGRFDPALHEAVATEERDDLEPGTVVETVRPGYTWRGQVLRHAHVKVARERSGTAGKRARDGEPS